MNKSTTVAFVAAAFFFVSTLTLIYLNYLQPKTLISTPTSSNSISVLTPTIATKAVDQTTDWKTHNNSDLGFSFKYPESYILDKKTSENQFSVHSPDFLENSGEGAAGSSATAIYRYNLENQKCSKLIANSATSAVSTLVLDTEGKPTLVAYKNEMTSPKPWASAYFDYSSNQCLIVNCSSDSDKGCGGGEIGVEFHKLLSTFKFTSPSNSLKSQVEDWGSYRKNSSALSWDKCDDEPASSSNLKGLMSVYPSFSKEINGVKITYTSKLDFTPEEIKNFVVCEAGAFYPVKIIGDKILWLSSCSTGASFQGIEKCEETLAEIRKIYQ